MKNCIRILVFLCMGHFLMAQSTTVTGTVLDSETQEPLPGVNVVIKNSNTGTTTDFDGKFVLANVNENDVLVFSYISFVTKEVRYTGQTNLAISLQPDVAALDEVVVIGYGTQVKKEITGAVAVVGSETIEELNPTRIEQALQGQVAGVNITAESGSPGSGSNIRIRGISTNGDNRPLILVDGNVIEDLSVLNPGDIESINVLKDATAGIYGVRAANGVVLITTKTGSKNSPLKFSYDAYGGFQQTSRKIPVLNATEYALLVNEAFAAGGSAIPFTDLSTLGTGTDWQNEVFQNAPIFNHNLTVNGGSEKSRYSFGASLLTQDGIVGGSKANFKRYTTRLNYDTDLLENLKLTTNLIYTGTERKTLSENGIGSVLFNALNNAPTFAVRDANGAFTLAEGLGNEVINPLAQIENSFNSTDVDRISGKIGLAYDFWDNFSANSSIQFNYSEVQGRFFTPTIFYGAGKVFNNSGRNTLTVNKDIFKDYTWDNYISYSNTFKENHKVQFTLGSSVFVTKGQFSGGTQGFFESPVNFAEADIANAVDLQNGLKDSGLSGKFDERLLSYFTRVQYDYKGKYLFSGVLRRDGSTKFGPENRFGYFPSGSLGWIVSEENFLANNSVVNFLKFRGSYGILGNDRIPGNAFRSILNGEGAYVFDGQLVFGQAVGVLSNPEIQWEEQKTLDIGVDLRLFDSRVDITADYFKKTTEGLLLQPQVSGILGASAPGAQAPVVNGGTVENSGFEFAIGYSPVRQEDFSIDLNYNVTFLNNEVTEVNNEAGFLQGGSFGIGQDPPARMEAGKPIGYFYGLETDGIFQNVDEVAAHATQANAAPGDIRFVDQNNDGIIDANDRVDIGNPIPDATMGFNLSINYKQFDFGAYAFASVGNEIVRNYERNQPLVNKSVYAINRWVGEGTSNTTPRLTTGATSNTLFSDYFVEDGSFVRLQNAQVGYTFPQAFMDRFGADKLRLYVSANNIFTFTEYRGYDPSASSGSPIGAGIDQGFYPVPRTFLLGINLNF
ncbi:SusC/RagA family protein [Croceivirga radicis]|uniref:SusC/RagA family protein n=1 Tax=Croceivirga radicis TaxID=1929488 RepID=A0A1V6LQ41_9FLAO|nr:TonB-dependent receptor [Croceivirga radicis]OQD42086.1 SusC/RagA family protein [Croceivirga radicis]